MKITRLWAQGYRSLRDVSLNDLGDCVVFYGPNGSGKSNVLRGIQTLLRAAAVWAGYERPGRARFAKALLDAQVLDADTPHLNDLPPAETVLGVELSAGAEGRRETAHALGRTLHARIRLELRVVWVERRPFEAELGVWFDDVPWEQAELTAQKTEPGALARATVARIAQVLYWPVDAARILRDDERIREGDGTDADDPAAEALRSGRPQTATFYAKNVSDPAQRARFEHFQRVVSETLKLPPLDVAWDPRSGLLDLRQPLRHAPDRYAVSMRNAGLGVEQVVSIAASLVFARASVVAIEEPEAHLHAPTTGRALRKLLASLVTAPSGQQPMLDQLFVATHSNLFDLDPNGYWDVSLGEDGATRIERKPLHVLYEHHLYEPGPARRILMDALARAGDRVVFRAKDGTRITAQEMIHHLDEDTDAAVEFLRDAHVAALTVLRVRARGDEP